MTTASTSNSKTEKGIFLLNPKTSFLDLIDEASLIAGRARALAAVGTGADGESALTVLNGRIVSSYMGQIEEQMGRLESILERLCDEWRKEGAS